MSLIDICVNKSTQLIFTTDHCTQHTTHTHTHTHIHTHTPLEENNTTTPILTPAAERHDASVNQKGRPGLEAGGEQCGGGGGEEAARHKQAARTSDRQTAGGEGRQRAMEVLFRGY